MTRTNNLEDLLKNIEKIRVEKYPYIPKNLVDSIIQIEFENQDARSEALSRIRETVTKYFNESRGN